MQHIVRQSLGDVAETLCLGLDKLTSILFRLLLLWLGVIFAAFQIPHFLYLWLIKGKSIRERRDRKHLESLLFEEDPPYGKHQYKQLGTRYFHYVESGDLNGPLVLFLHDFPECWWEWRNQLASLNDMGYHLVALDLPGFGGTNPPAHLTLEQLVADLRNLIAELHPSGRAHTVVGHGWGGLVAYAAAMESWRLDQFRNAPRGFIDKLIISNSPHPLVIQGNLLFAAESAVRALAPRALYRAPLEAVSAALGHVWAILEQVLRSYYIFIFQLPSPIPELWLQAFDYDTFIGTITDIAGPKNISTRDMDIYKAALAYQDGKGIKSAVQMYRLLAREEWLVRYYISAPAYGYRLALKEGSIWREQVGPNFGKIGYPTVVLWGDRDPYLGKNVSLQKTSDFLADPLLIHIPKCGHFLPEERPDLFTKYISLFIKGRADTK